MRNSREVRRGLQFSGCHTFRYICRLDVGDVGLSACDCGNFSCVEVDARRVETASSEFHQQRQAYVSQAYDPYPSLLALETIEQLLCEK
jgi:hypothetical protein